MRNLVPVILIANSGSKIIKFGLAAVLLLLSQGCVGFYVRYMHETEFKDPSIRQEASLYGLTEVHPVDATNHVEYTSAWLQSHWGTPASVRQVGGEGGAAIWIYKFSRCWCGIIPGIFVPIPLMLPVGREKVSFVIREDRVVSAAAVEARTTGAAAGLAGPEGFGAWSDASSR